MRVDGLEVGFELAAAGLGDGGVSGGLEVGLGRKGHRGGGACLGSECGVEGKEVGEALLDGEGPEGKAEGDRVDCVGFGAGGEECRWDRYFHSML